jgi:pyrophosphatase PpaX
MLGDLKALGYKMAVVTSRAALTTQQAMERYEIQEYFDVVVTCDDTDKHKPDPEPVLIALAQLKSGPEESIMIGDSMYDILCAKNAGVQSVLVGWAVAVTEEEKTGPDKPDYFVQTAQDIVRLLKRM